jgi:hypothetical protein
MSAVFNAAGQRVTCRDCKRTYTCTPEEDYFGDADGGLPESATAGRCFSCLLKTGGLNPETTPVQVIDLSGTGTDPRDLSRRPSGGKP